MYLHEELMAQDVKRWHTVPTARQQTVAEHSFCVAMIARRISYAVGPKALDPEEVVCRALHHDLHEVWDGDMPSNKTKPIDLPGQSGEGAINFCVKMADVIEAHAFIHWYGLGPRAGNIDGSYDDLIRDTIGALRARGDVALAGFVHSVWREALEGRTRV